MIAVNRGRSIATPFEKPSGQLLLFLIALLFVGALFGPNLRADFGLMDDHEILGYVQKSAGRLGDYFQLLASSEVGKFGHSNRYRPGYYAIYVAESMLWGANPLYWYLFRFFMCATFVYACLRIVGRYYGFSLALLFVALTFSYTYWTDIWSRLGAGEAYCAFGWGLFSIAFVEMVAAKPPKSEWPWNLLLVAGVFIAAGAKENFLLLIVPVLVLGWIRFRRGTLTKGLAVSLGLSAAYIAVIVLSLWLAFAEGRPDTHANPVTLEGRLRTLKTLLSLKEFYFSAAVFALGAFALLLQARVSRLKVLRNSLVAVAATGFCCVLLVATQVVFYNGAWPANVRFDFPGMMAAPVLAISVTSLAGGLIRSYWKSLPTFALPLAVFLAMAGSIYGGFKDNYKGSLRNVALTHEVTSKVRLISKALREDPSAALVIESYGPIDYEPIVALKKFLRFYGVANPLLVRVQGYTPEMQQSDLHKMLAKAILGWDAESRKQLSEMKSCYSVHIAGHGPTNCRDLARL